MSPRRLLRDVATIQKGHGKLGATLADGGL